MRKKRYLPNQTTLDFDADPPFLSVEDIYDAATPELLRKLKEDRRIERKVVGCQGESLAVYFSMWANTDPSGGLIAVGISNTGELVGCAKSETEAINRIERTDEVFCSDAKFRSKHVEFAHRDGTRDFVILFHVEYHETRVVKLTNGKAYTRIGESKKELTAEEIRELASDKGEVHFEQERSNANYPDDFNPVAIQDFVDAVRSQRGMPES